MFIIFLIVSLGLGTIAYNDHDSNLKTTAEYCKLYNDVPSFCNKQNELEMP